MSSTLQNGITLPWRMPVYPSEVSVGCWGRFSADVHIPRVETADEAKVTDGSWQTTYDKSLESAHSVSSRDPSLLGVDFVKEWMSHRPHWRDRYVTPSSSREAVQFMRKLLDNYTQAGIRTEELETVFRNHGIHYFSAARLYRNLLNDVPGDELTTETTIGYLTEQGVIAGIACCKDIKSFFRGQAIAITELGRALHKNDWSQLHSRIRALESRSGGKPIAQDEILNELIRSVFPQFKGTSTDEIMKRASTDLIDFMQSRDIAEEEKDYVTGHMVESGAARALAFPDWLKSLVKGNVSRKVTLTQLMSNPESYMRKRGQRNWMRHQTSQLLRISFFIWFLGPKSPFTGLAASLLPQSRKQIKRTILEIAGSLGLQERDLRGWMDALDAPIKPSSPPPSPAQVKATSREKPPSEQRLDELEELFEDHAEEIPKGKQLRIEGMIDDLRTRNTLRPRDLESLENLIAKNRTLTP